MVGSTEQETRSDAAGFIDDPCAFFDRSYTAMHSIAPAALSELQIEALRLRFADHRERIPMVAKLADRQGIATVDDVDDVVPLLFEHTMYKSYPSSLIAGGRFPQLTSWLDRLTSLDLSQVDASHCDSVASWLRTLLDEAALDPTFSSGTSGTMSFIPWSARDLEARGLTRRISELQTFGVPPTSAQLDDPVHHITLASRTRRDHVAAALSGGREGYSHLLNPDGDDPDLLWLAARLRLAAAKGDITRVEVPPSLLARREELERMNASAPERADAWLDEILAIRGTVLWSGQPHGVHEIATRALGQGRSCAFGEGSVLVYGGGAKGHTLPDDWVATIEAFVNAPVKRVYGMTEVAAMHVQCRAGRYHVQPWVIAYVLDLESSAPLPRQGVQRGRAAFFDLLADSHWGGVITGDEIEIDFDGGCECGATTAHIADDVERIADRLGDDKITCTATPEAHAEAMNFLVGY